MQYNIIIEVQGGEENCRNRNNWIINFPNIINNPNTRI